MTLCLFRNKKGTKSLSSLYKIRKLKGGRDQTIVLSHGSTSTSTSSSSQHIEQQLCTRLIITDVDYDTAFMQFKTAGLDTHLCSYLGKQKTQRAAKTCINRTTTFCLWVYYQINQRNFDWSESMSIVGLLASVLTEHYSKFMDFALYLENSKKFSASTICNHLYDIIEVSRWVGYFKSANNQTPLKIDLHGFEATARAIRRVYGKKRKSQVSEKCLENVVASRRLPIEGLKTLIECVEADMAWFHNLTDQLKLESPDSDDLFVLDELIYKHFMRLLFSSLYVFSVNGRCGGIEDMRFRQGEELVQRGFANSNVFKTRSVFGYQPVTISCKSKKILKVYVDYIRPMVDKENKMSRPDDPLWLTWNCEKETKVSRHVTKFFKLRLGLHITTNSIRSLIETKAKSLLEEGKISLQTREAVSNINGHSSATVESYYLMNDRITDVHNSRPLFDHINSEINLDTSECADDSEQFDTSQSNWASHANLQYDDWGTNHPDYQKTLKRAKWTDEEVKFIGDWCSKTINDNPEARSRIIALCWKHIMFGNGKRAALPLFHESHILDSGRLRHGFRNAQNSGLYSNLN
jgi:hypothetical protein